jgi:DNA invertase Pin-like site-specific DNA recombinase
MARIGYARVSTIDQDLETQLAKLKAEGCSIIRSKKISGGSREGRVELATVLRFLCDGDELVVTRLDRLGRNTRDVLNLIHE